MKKNIIYVSLLIMMFSLTTLYGSEVETVVGEDGIQELTIEDAIIQAQKRNKTLKTQKTNIEIAKVNTEAAKDYYYNSAWEVGYEEASANYSKAIVNKEYQVKNEDVMAEQIGFDIENRFDDILELEEKHELLSKNLLIQKQKVAHAMKKEELGLGSNVATKAEEIKLELQNKEKESLIQAIDIEYRKLNDAIGAEEERYNLIKENSYEPLEMERSLQGQISHAINSDLGIWLLEELAKTQKGTFTAPNPGPLGGAPTYTLYQQRKLSYEKDLNDIALNKEGKEEQIKQLYENIQALEIQHDKIIIDLEEAQRQYGIMKKRYELGMITALNLEEVELAVLQNELQLSSTIRQHNQLKIMFEKSYLGATQKGR